MEPRRGRGRIDNGLDAALWVPLRDVDPGVGEHLLDLLRDAGIAAYLEPAADVSPYTRTVYLPSPPADRLFVDRTRRTEAQQLVASNADEHAPPAPPTRGRLRRDLDEDAEWRRIVAAFEAEHGRSVVEEPAPAAPAAPVQAPEPTAPPSAAEPDLLELPEEHFEPPPPPPLKAPAPASLYAVLLIAAGALLIIAPGLIGLSGDIALVLGVIGVAGGVGVLVSRMRDRSVDDDGDDGAVV